MTDIFFNFWRKGGFALALASILFCYTALPDNLAITHKETGEPVGFISKETFFYVASGVFLGFNLLLGAFKDQLMKIDFLKVNPTSKWAQKPKALSGLIKTWFNGFLAFTNTYLVFVLLGLYNVNSNKGQKLDFNYNWLLIFGVTMLLIILFILPIKLLYTNPPSEND